MGEKDRVTGPELFFDFTNGAITFKRLSGYSGQVWSGGRVSFGTVWEDDGDPEPGKPVALPTWIDECLKLMKRAK